MSHSDSASTHSPTSAHSGGLRSVSKTQPCPHCGKPDWCYFLGESLSACKRSAPPTSGWVATGIADKEGTPYYAQAASSENKKVRPKNFRIWEYPDRTGNRLVRVCRLDDGEGNRKIWQEAWNGKRWVKDIQGVGREDIPVYRYAEIRQAIERGETVFIVEGEPCADALWALGVPATCNIGGSGKWKPSDSTDLAGAEVVLCPDRDEAGVKHMELIARDFPEAKWLYAFPERWKNLPKSGGLDICDWIEDFKLSKDDILAAVREKLEKQFDSGQHSRSSSSSAGRKKKKPEASLIARAIAEEYRHQLAWNIPAQSWYRYGAQQEGLWATEPVECVCQVIEAHLDANPETEGYGINYVHSIEKLLRHRLSVRVWDEPPGYVPLLNGTLNLETLTLEPHTPALRLTWCLPYRYDPTATCKPVQQWLRETAGGKEDVVQLLRAFLNAAVKGRADLQQFLELFGPGGTGKSTYIRLLQALVGVKNTFTTELKYLESNRFETSGICGKRVVVITDSERYGGNVTVLKALTGEDTIRNERKFAQNDSEGFTFGGVVVVAANEIIQSADYTSGLQRRRITVPLTNKIPPELQRNLIAFHRGKPTGEFVSCLPGLLNWVLEMPDAEVTRILKDWGNAVPSLQLAQGEAITEVNPIADWADSCLVVAPNSKTYVGVAKRDKSPDSPNQFLSVGTWLYANYAEYSLATGSKPVSTKRFTPLLRDLMGSQLSYQIRHDRDSRGSYFEGLEIRKTWEHDHLPRPITGLTPWHLSSPPDMPPGGGSPDAGAGPSGGAG